MSRQELFKRMAQSIIDGEIETAGELAQESLAAGINPLESINRGFKAGLDEIGRGFETGDYFLPDLMVGGRAMQAAVAIVLRVAESPRHVDEHGVLGKPPVVIQGAEFVALRFAE